MALKFATPAAEAYQFPLTIGHLLDSALIGAAEQQIVYRDQLTISYRQLRQRIGQLASLLADHGVAEGTTVAVMDWDSHRYLEAYFAIPMMGAVLQPVNVRLSAHQIAYALRHAEAELLLVHRDFVPLVEEMLPELPAAKTVIIIQDGSSDPLPAYGVGEYEQLLAQSPSDYPFRDFDENAIATTFYTSGTTGNPKGVCFTHRQLVLHTLATTAPFGAGDSHPGLGHGDVYMPLTPMFHVHAWGKPYVATMLGLQQVYPGRYEPELICELRRKHRVTYSHCVPTILEMVLEAAERTGHDLSGWKMTIGGSKLTAKLFDKASGRGMKIAAGYGMSETGPIISLARAQTNDPGRLSDASTMTSSGAIIPLVSARIVDEAMQDLPSDGKSGGELVLRAPWLTPCYTGDEQASAALWQGGWMHTQDIASLDSSGVIMIRDRIKDVIKSGGEWLDSLQIEELICVVPGVKEVSVIAVPDAKWGERPLAVIVADVGALPTLSMLNESIAAAAANGLISSYARIERLAFMDALPRTSVGKIDKKVLRQRFADVGSAPAQALASSMPATF